ncbi:MAG: helix-turn-helix domain-containing protein [Phycisphaerales bacterium]|nr:helix-turn-helix domain-containing protein [Phycisphaerales bacterium]
MARTPRAPGRALPPPEVMTISDLAEYLQVSKSSLYKLVQQGKVPGQKVGKHWRFRKDTVDQWLSASSEQTRSRAGETHVNPSTS